MDIVAILESCWSKRSVLVLDKSINVYEPKETYKIIENHDVLGATIISASHYDKYMQFIKHLNTVVEIKCKLYKNNKDDNNFKERLPIVEEIYEITNLILEKK